MPEVDGDERSVWAVVKANTVEVFWWVYMVFLEPLVVISVNLPSAVVRLVLFVVRNFLIVAGVLIVLSILLAVFGPFIIFWMSS